MEKGGTWATDVKIAAIASLLGFNVIVQAEYLGDGIDHVRYKASLCEHGLNIQHLNHHFLCSHHCPVKKIALVFAKCYKYILLVCKWIMHITERMTRRVFKLLMVII